MREFNLKIALGQVLFAVKEIERYCLQYKSKLYKKHKNQERLYKIIQDHVSIFRARRLTLHCSSSRRSL